MSGTPRVAVIGCGIAGLSTGYYLKRRGVSVTLFEATDRAGGVIRSHREQGFLYEAGPNTIQADDRVIEFITEIGVADQVLEADPVQRNRYVVRDGTPRPLPMGPIDLLKTPLFSLRGKLRLLAEPFVSRGDHRESVAEFVRRRVGRDFLDYAIDPFVAGVYAGNPEHLMMRYAFPRMMALEDEYGSLVRGSLARMLKRRRSGARSARRRLISFDGGMEALPRALETLLRGSIRFGSRISALEPSNGAWYVRGQDHQDSGSFGAVVSTVPLHRVHELHLDVSPELTDVSYPPVTVVALGYPRSSVRHPLDGFGVLVPSVERGLEILGILFNSSIFPNRAPDDTVLITVFLGGARHPDASYLGTEAAVDVAHQDASVLLGIGQRPVFERMVHWQRGIPQYDRSYEAAVGAMQALEGRHRGLFLAGNYRAGISVADTIQSGRVAADRAAAFVTGAT